MRCIGLDVVGRTQPKNERMPTTASGRFLKREDAFLSCFFSNIENIIFSNYDSGQSISIVPMWLSGTDKATS